MLRPASPIPRLQSTLPTLRSLLASIKLCPCHHRIAILHPPQIQYPSLDDEGPPWEMQICLASIKTPWICLHLAPLGALWDPRLLHLHPEPASVTMIPPLPPARESYGKRRLQQSIPIQNWPQERGKLCPHPMRRSQRSVEKDLTKTKHRLRMAVAQVRAARVKPPAHPPHAPTPPALPDAL